MMLETELPNRFDPFDSLYGLAGQDQRCARLTACPFALSAISRHSGVRARALACLTSQMMGRKP